MIKENALRHAAEFGLVLVLPDTSPWGLGLPGKEDSWDFGRGRFLSRRGSAGAARF